MCSTHAFWLDFNEHLQIPIKLNIPSTFSPDLQPPSIWPASSQHLAGMKPASSRHPASIQPASSQHQTSIQPASTRHPASIDPASSQHPTMHNKLCYLSF
jgi:hypothetical protein